MTWYWGQRISNQEDKCSHLQGISVLKVSNCSFKEHPNCLWIVGLGNKSTWFRYRPISCSGQTPCRHSLHSVWKWEARACDQEIPRPGLSIHPTRVLQLHISSHDDLNRWTCSYQGRVPLSYWEFQWERQNTWLRRGWQHSCSGAWMVVSLFPGLQRVASATRSHFQ